MCLHRRIVLNQKGFGSESPLEPSKVCFFLPQTFGPFRTFPVEPSPTLSFSWGHVRSWYCLPLGRRHTPPLQIRKPLSTSVRKRRTALHFFVVCPYIPHKSFWPSCLWKCFIKTPGRTTHNIDLPVRSSLYNTGVLQTGSPTPNLGPFLKSTVEGRITIQRNPFNEVQRQEFEGVNILVRRET